MIITNDIKPAQVEIIFYVQEGTNSPYQGRLIYDASVYSSMTADQIAADQTAQFNAWKEATVAAQAANEAAANTIPAQITAPQARAAILAAGLKDAVEAAVAQADQATQDLWYTAANIERANPILIALATVIGLSSDDIDALFVAGAAL